jgi:hypothetical protein
MILLSNYLYFVMYYYLYRSVFTSSLEMQFHSISLYSTAKVSIFIVFRTTKLK